MNKPKVTPWFSPRVKPVRAGVYERNHGEDGFPRGTLYSFWGGRFWGGWAADRKGALKNQFAPSSVQNIAWRGLARKPRSAKEPQP